MGRNLVIFDASALIGQYLKPLMRGEPLKDFLFLKKNGLQPSILQRTLGEIWQHVILGTGKAAHWVKEDPTYPKSIESIVARLQNLDQREVGEKEDSLDPRLTAWFWHNVSEEWDSWWDDREQRFKFLERYLKPAKRPKFDLWRELYEEFFEWKSSMKRFCRRIERAFTDAGRKSYPFGIVTTKFQIWQKPGLLSGQ